MAYLKNIRDLTINLLQNTSDERQWGLRYGPLNDSDIELLRSGNYGKLGWKWAFETYFSSEEVKNGMVDLAIKIETAKHTYPDACSLFRYNYRHPRFEICIMENFVRPTKSVLDGRVWLSTALFSATFAKAVGLEEVFLLEPANAHESRYKQFGFYRDISSPMNMTAELTMMQDAIKDALK